MQQAPDDTSSGLISESGERLDLKLGRSPDNEVVVAYRSPRHEHMAAGDVELADGTVVPRFVWIGVWCEDGLLLTTEVEIEASGQLRVLSHTIAHGDEGAAIPLTYSFDLKPWLRAGAAALLAEARTSGVGLRGAHAPTPASDEFLYRVHELYSEGRTLAEIGQLYGRSVSAASRWYSRAVAKLNLPDERKSR